MTLGRDFKRVPSFDPINLPRGKDAESLVTESKGVQVTEVTVTKIYKTDKNNNNKVHTM